jgi:hypothetical protein
VTDGRPGWRLGGPRLIIPGASLAARGPPSKGDGDVHDVTVVDQPVDQGTRRDLVAQDLVSWTTHHETQGGCMTLTAINVLLDPDAATIEKARATNARLREDYPGGFALDANHAPHVTILQRFVRTADLDQVAKAVVDVLRTEQSMNWESKATGYHDLAYQNLGLVGIVIEPTQDLRRLQQRIIEAVAPFAAAKGTGEAFAPRPDGRAISQPTVDYVNNFVGPSTGMNYHPHLTVGIGTRDFVDALKAEPFNAFAVRAVSVSLYQLGDYGVAQRKLHDLHRC